jgi:outer membrane protein
MGTLALLSVCLAAAPALTLDDALAAATKRNVQLALARLDQEAAAVDVRQSYQGVLPRLDLTGGVGRQFQGEQEGVNVVPNASPPPDFVRTVVTIPSNDFGAYQYGLALSWTLFDGLASWNLIASSRTRSAAAGRQLDESTLRVAFEVTRRFYEVVKQQRALEVRRETAALSEELVKRADALFSAGRGTKADTFSARVNLGNDRIAVRNQAAVLERARADLAVVLGLTSDVGLEVVPPGTVTQPDVSAQAEILPLPALLAEARKRRPVLAARKLVGEASDKEIARARGAYWPVLGLLASYDKGSSELGGRFGLFGALSAQYVATAQLTLAWNLFEGGATRAGVQRAEVEARRAWALLEQDEQAVSAEVTVAREQLAALVDTTRTVQENLAAADAGLRLARERLDAGVASQLEVRDATLKLAEARLQWVSTIVDLVVARADLNRAVGGSL